MFEDDESGDEDVEADAPAPLHWPSQGARADVVALLQLESALTPAGKPEEAEALIARAHEAGALESANLGDPGAVVAAIRDWVEAWEPAQGALPGLEGATAPEAESAGAHN